MIARWAKMNEPCSRNCAVEEQHKIEMRHIVISTMYEISLKSFIYSPGIFRQAYIVKSRKLVAAGDRNDSAGRYRQKLPLVFDRSLIACRRRYLPSDIAHHEPGHYRLHYDRRMWLSPQCWHDRCRAMISLSMLATWGTIVTRKWGFMIYSAPCRWISNVWGTSDKEPQVKRRQRR